MRACINLTTTRQQGERVHGLRDATFHVMSIFFYLLIIVFLSLYFYCWMWCVWRTRDSETNMGGSDKTIFYQVSHLLTPLPFILFKFINLRQWLGPLTLIWGTKINYMTNNVVFSCWKNQFGEFKKHKKKINNWLFGSICHLGSNILFNLNWEACDWTNKIYFRLIFKSV